MLEQVWLKEELENKYLQILLFGLVFTILGGYVTRFMFNVHTGLVSVFVISLIAAYPTVRYMREEGVKEESMAGESELTLLETHGEEIGVYLSLFIGVLIGFFVLSYIMGPQFFGVQVSEINRIRGENILSGSSGAVLSSERISNYILIVRNNLSVFSITLVVSFFFVAGAIFILAWNASILGIFISEASKSIYQVPVYVLAYLPHGIIEISAYILAGISGALISRQAEDFLMGEEEFSVLSSAFRDIMFLVAIGVGLVFLGGLVEVFL